MTARRGAILNVDTGVDGSDGPATGRYPVLVQPDRPRRCRPHRCRPRLETVAGPRR